MKKMEKIVVSPIRNHQLDTPFVFPDLEGLGEGNGATTLGL